LRISWMSISPPVWATTPLEATLYQASSVADKHCIRYLVTVPRHICMVQYAGDILISEIEIQDNPRRHISIQKSLQNALLYKCTRSGTVKNRWKLCRNT
jgi:hypothetical protein